MTITRTPIIAVDVPFAVDVAITKAFVDTATGRRTIVGVASGVAEDRDGERVSANAIKSMVRQLESGAGIKLTTGHQQDWLTEIGDVVQATHDAKSDELIVKTELPPEGVDAIADKAWRSSQTEKLGFSIGGKLRGAYFERNELGKKRKVLDAIDWRHVALTKHPSYANSFAEAVAKTWDGTVPDDAAFTEPFDPDSIAKDSTTGSWVGGDSSGGGGNVGRDSVGSGKRNAGTKSGAKGQNTDSADDDLPEAPDERHLACPQCGHEFAADLPVDASERQGDAPDTDKDSDTGKTAKKEGLMATLTETLDALKALAAADDVAKTTPEPAKTAPEPAASTPEATAPAAAAAEDVAKTPEAPDTSLDVAKLVAASHKHSEERFERFETAVGEAFGIVAKSHQQIVKLIEDMPQGRKSVARILPKPNGHDEEAVEKTTEQLVAEASDPIAALKVLNAKTYGIN